ncbi:GNAT family N-acetyltransferase [Moritella dasanensis]|uniref:GNAT family N-acetyltransferase n=1 Tax=Moritella dasanensis TaxID=428031 RepID=UPI0003117583|nr:GNAT family N-acetyltransferase [Moritella dasanensis]
MVTIEKLTSSTAEDVLNVTLAEQQTKFAGSAKEFLADDSESIHLHVIKSEHEVIGFFKIDVMYSIGDEFDVQNGLGLRAFVIDQNQQGKGLGTASVKALFPYLKQNYSSYRAIYLTVNCQNPGARACYEKGGFVDTGEKYLGGAAGPQYIMQGNIA